jgi:hypothetical protein
MEEYRPRVFGNGAEWDIWIEGGRSDGRVEKTA